MRRFCVQSKRAPPMPALLLLLLLSLAAGQTGDWAGEEPTKPLYNLWTKEIWESWLGYDISGNEGLIISNTTKEIEEELRTILCPSMTESWFNNTELETILQMISNGTSDPLGWCMETTTSLENSVSHPSCQGIVVRIEDRNIYCSDLTKYQRQYLNEVAKNVYISNSKWIYARNMFYSGAMCEAIVPKFETGSSQNGTAPTVSPSLNNITKEPCLDSVSSYRDALENFVELEFNMGVIDRDDKNYKLEKVKNETETLSLECENFIEMIRAFSEVPENSSRLKYISDDCNLKVFGVKSENEEQENESGEITLERMLKSSPWNIIFGQKVETAQDPIKKIARKEMTQRYTDITENFVNIDENGTDLESIYNSNERFNSAFLDPVEEDLKEYLYVPTELPWWAILLIVVGSVGAFVGLVIGLRYLVKIIKKRIETPLIPALDISNSESD